MSMQNEFKDGRLKYMEMFSAFTTQALEIDVCCKQSQRACEKMAKQLAARHPKTADEFEKVENMKDFVFRTAQANEKTIKLLEFINKFLQAIAEDAKTLMQGAQIQDQLKDQSETIEHLIQTRESFISQIKQQRQNGIR